MTAFTTIGDRGHHLIIRRSRRQAERYLDYLLTQDETTRMRPFEQTDLGDMTSLPVDLNDIDFKALPPHYACAYDGYER